MNTLSQYLEDRDDRRRAGSLAQTPEGMIQTLLGHINAQFYGDAEAETWLRDETAIKLVLLWPATWLSQRGVGLPVDRYEAIMREIIVGIQRHGATAEIRHFPTYFRHTVEQWFVHHGDELYHERKRIRNLIDARLLQGRPQAPKEPDPTEALAAARAVLAAGRKRAKKASEDAPELPLMGA